MLASVLLDLSDRIYVVLAGELERDGDRWWAGLQVLACLPVVNDAQVAVVLLARSVGRASCLLLGFVALFLLLLVGVALGTFALRDFGLILSCWLLLYLFFRFNF